MAPWCLAVDSWFLRSRGVSRTKTEQCLHQYLGVDFQYSAMVGGLRQLGSGLIDSRFQRLERNVGRVLEVMDRRAKKGAAATNGFESRACRRFDNVFRRLLRASLSDVQ